MFTIIYRSKLRMNTMSFSLTLFFYSLKIRFSKCNLIPLFCSGWCNNSCINCYCCFNPVKEQTFIRSITQNTRTYLALYELKLKKKDYVKKKQFNSTVNCMARQSNVIKSKIVSWKSRIISYSFRYSDVHSLQLFKYALPMCFLWMQKFYMPAYIFIYFWTA